MSGELILPAQIQRAVETAVEIQQTNALDAGSIGFAARLWAQLSLPYKDPGDIPRWTRKNGALQLTVRPATVRNPVTGEERDSYPYGVIPRYILTWISTEAVTRKSATLPLGDTLSGFLDRLSLGRHGGVRGDITRLNDQAQRLLGSTIQVSDARTTGSHSVTRFQNVTIADSFELWTPHNTKEKPLGESHVQLSQAFFDSIMEAPVPIDLRALQALKGSPLRIDIYTWLVHRLPYLSRKSTVPWTRLALQFGSDFKRLRAFRASFEKNLQHVLTVYPDAVDAVESTDSGLVIRQAAPAVPRRARRLGSAPQLP